MGLAIIDLIWGDQAIAGTVDRLTLEILRKMPPIPVLFWWPGTARGGSKGSFPGAGRLVTAQAVDHMCVERDEIGAGGLGLAGAAQNKHVRGLVVRGLENSGKVQC